MPAPPPTSDANPESLPGPSDIRDEPGWLVTHFTHRPFVPAAVALGAGILAEDAWGQDVSAHFVPIALGTALGAGLIAYGLRWMRGWSGMAPLWASVLVLVAGTGMLRLDHVRGTPDAPGSLAAVVRPEKPRTVMVEGVVAAAPEYRPGRRWRFLLDATAIHHAAGPPTPVYGRTRLTLRDADVVAPPVVIGERVRLPAVLRRPENFENPGAFDYVGYLAGKGIHVTGYVLHIDAIEHMPGEPSLWHRFLRPIVRARQAATLSLGRRGNAGGVLAALLTGDQAFLTDASRTLYQRAGVAHLLAISGLHVGLVMLLAYTSVRWMLLRSERVALALDVSRVGAVITLPVIGAYILFTGAHLTTIRAGVMIGVLVLGYLVRRAGDKFNSLALAAFSILLVWPGSLFEAGFQLSFSAVAGIIVAVNSLPYLHERVLRLYDEMEWSVWFSVQERVFDGLVLTAGASLATLGFVTFHFGGMGGAILLTNLLGIFLLGIILGTGIIGVVLLGVSATLADIVVAAPLWLLDKFHDSLTFLAPGFTYLFRPAWYEVALYYSLLLALGAYVYSRHRDHRAGRRMAAALLALALGLVALDAGARIDARFFNDRLRVTFLEVGHGDAALVAFPGATRWLIDGGGLRSATFDTGEEIVAPAVLTDTIHSLDVVVATHSDHDHIGGLPYILDNFSVGELWISAAFAGNGRYSRLLAAAERNDIPVFLVDTQSLTHAVIAHRGGEYPFVAAPCQPTSQRTCRPHRPSAFAQNGIAVTVLHPPPDARVPDNSEGTDRNNASLVMKLTETTPAPFSVLFTGDIEKETETLLVDRYNGALRSTVLKVAHHGSQSSSTPAFLDAVAPDMAVISVRRRSKYSLPHPAVIRRLEERATVYRTDLDGAVTLPAAP